jgi:transposase
MRLVYLPPYSPDFNPIEEGFSAFKALIRRHQHYVRTALCAQDNDIAIRALTIAVCNAMTPDKAAGWYRHSGYTVPVDRL